MDAIDLEDVLKPELDRLKALAELLRRARPERDGELLGGVGELAGDVEARMRRVLRRFSASRRGRASSSG